MNKAFEKAIASARYFKNKGEIDMWHCIWHEGKPYDYHLFVDYCLELKKDITLAVIYKTNKLEDGTYQIDTSHDLYVHQFRDKVKPSSKLKKIYKVVTTSIATTTYTFEAKSEEDARDQFLSGSIDYSYDDQDYHDETIDDVQFYKYEESNEDI